MQSSINKALHAKLNYVKTVSVTNV